MFIYVQNGRVVGSSNELIEVHPSYEIIEHDQDVPISWVWNGSTFTWPPELEDEVRQLRNECLIESDRVVGRFLAAQQEVPTEYIEFRQKLRDLTDQAGFPYDVTFPEEPEITLPEYLY